MPAGEGINPRAPPRRSRRRRRDRRRGTASPPGRARAPSAPASANPSPPPSARPTPRTPRRPPRRASAAARRGARATHRRPAQRPEERRAAAAPPTAPSSPSVSSSSECASRTCLVHPAVLHPAHREPPAPSPCSGWASKPSNATRYRSERVPFEVVRRARSCRHAGRRAQEVLPLARDEVPRRSQRAVGAALDRVGLRHVGGERDERRDHGQRDQQRAHDAAQRLHQQRRRAPARSRDDDPRERGQQASGRMSRPRGAPRITASAAAAPATPAVSSSEPRCAPSATSTTAPTISASHVPRLRLR